MYQTQEKACKDCTYCRPETFVFFKSYEMARCAFPVSQATHKSKFIEAFGGHGFCYWERHPLGFCRKEGVHWQPAQRPAIADLIAARSAGTNLVHA